jgi:hypothetical protein
MHRQRFFLTALLGALVSSIGAIAPQPTAMARAAASASPQKKASAKTTATLHDYDALGATLLLRSDDYNGVGQASYPASSSHGSFLINTIGDAWNLNLAQQSLRAVYITPNDPIDNLQPPGPPAGYHSEAVVRCGCFDQNTNIVPLANVVTSSGNCTLGLNFNSGGTSYKLLMSPFPLSGNGTFPPTCPSTGCPATGLVTVTCNAVSNGQCVDWTVEPNVTAPNANVANLYRLSSTGPRSTTWVFLGQYYNSFRIGLTNQ